MKLQGCIPEQLLQSIQTFMGTQSEPGLGTGGPLGGTCCDDRGSRSFHFWGRAEAVWRDTARTQDSKLEASGLQHSRVWAPVPSVPLGVSHSFLGEPQVQLEQRSR